MADSRFVYVAAGMVFGALGYAVISPVQMAVAQIPDQGAQLAALIEQTKSINAKMDRLVGVLEGGKLQVVVKKDDAAPAR